MSKITIDGEELEFSGTIESFVIRLGKNPDSYIFLIHDVPTPMDADVPDDVSVKAVRVASGG